MGDTLGPRLPFWLEVVTDRADVAVVVLGLPSILTGPLLVNVRCGAKLHLSYNMPSGSEPAIELRPLLLWR